MARRANVILFNSLSSYARMGISFFISLGITRTALTVVASNPDEARRIFGIFSLLLAVIGFSRFIQDSILKALIRFLAVSLHGGNEERTVRLLSSGWAMSVVSGVVFAGLMAGPARWIVHLFQIPVDLELDACRAVWLMAGAYALMAAVQPWLAVMRAEDRYTLDNIAQLAQQSLVLLGLLVLPHLRWGPLVELSAAWFIPPLIIAATLSAWMALSHPFLRIRRHAVRWSECRELISLGGWSSVVALGSNLYERTDQVLVNLLLGPAFNTFYAIVIQLEGYVSMIGSALTNVMLPTASRIADAGSTWEKQQLIIRATRYVMAITLPLVLIFSFLGRQFVHIWLGKGYDEAIRIIPWGMLLVFLRAPNLVAWSYLTALNKLKWPSLALLIDAIANVFLSIAYTLWLGWGLSGIILGTLSTNFLRLVFFQGPYTAAQVGLSPWEYWKGAFGRVVMGLLWLGPALWLLHIARWPIWWTLPALGVLGVLYAAWLWWFIFENYERTLFRQVLGRFFFRKPPSPPAVAKTREINKTVKIPDID